jgi:hypothetical protein
MSFDRRFVFFPVVAALFAVSVHGETVTFENLLGAPESSFKGDTSTVNEDPWTVDGFEFANSTQFVGFWSGWAYSNTTDTTTGNFLNEQSAAPGGGSNGRGGKDGAAPGETYALAYDSGVGRTLFNLPAGVILESVDWTNGTYPLFSMTNGDAFAKKFGGESGDDPDFFRAILTGYVGLDGQGPATGTVRLDLADFTSADNSNDFIVDTWQVNEDLTALGNAQSVGVTFESSDVGMFGINTPRYLFIDNLQYSITAVPEPASATLLALTGILVACRRRR